MIIGDTSTTTQAVRRIYENGHAAVNNGAGIIRIVCHLDASSGKNILLWDDLKVVFNNAVYVRSGDIALPFLKGPDFKKYVTLSTHFIAVVPGVTLGIVVPEPVAIVVPGPAAITSSLPSGLQQIAQQAAQFPRHDPLSALRPHHWTSTSHLTNSNNISRTINNHREPILLTSRRQPNNTATQAQRRALELGKVKAILRKIAVSTDLDALHSKGDGRPQDFRKALECYLVTIQKGQAQALVSVGDLFLVGQGIQQSPTVAIGWYLKAAYLGDNNARYKIDQLRLGLRVFSPLQAPLPKKLKDAQHDKHRDNDTAGNSSLDIVTVTAEGLAPPPIRTVVPVSSQKFLPTFITFTPALADIVAKARLGDCTAQETLADMLMDGRDVLKDVQAAIDWYLTADSHGSEREIQRKLHVICYSNLEVTQEFVTAVDRHRKAADQGDSTAQRNVGSLYLAAMEYREAKIWFEKAAEQGDAAAQLDVGLLHHKGLGVFQNHSKAMNWFQMAAKQGNAIAQYYVGFLYHRGGDVSQDHAQAMTWFQMAAEQGNTTAQYYVGYLYYQGGGVPQDYAKAMTWFQRAAEQGHDLAQFYIGRMYQKGTGVFLNYAKAMTWYRKAAEQGHVSAQYYVGKLYHQGLGVSQDYAEAMTWYLMASKHQLAGAQCAIGHLYYDGCGVPQDYAKAMEWYQMAAQTRYPYAEYRIGLMLENGLGVNKDTSMALECYKKAAARGDSEAENAFKILELKMMQRP
ncbi:hypothetical protein EC991_006229 [Linnemannia zychae]|nr:hypothetical protein EC991_006229 [Linnemannia zychae]